MVVKSLPEEVVSVSSNSTPGVLPLGTRSWKKMKVEGSMMQKGYELRWRRVRHFA